jgi:hypothetical protein
MKKSLFLLMTGALVVGGLALVAGASDGPSRSHTVFGDFPDPTW